MFLTHNMHLFGIKKEEIYCKNAQVDSLEKVTRVF
jgi:hypothetical protein